MSRAEDAREMMCALAKARNVLQEIGAEYQRAASLYPPMNSAPEGYAVLLEELDELWDEIRKKPHLRNPAAMRKEAVQVAAMALRFIVDLLPEGSRAQSL